MGRWGDKETRGAGGARGQGDGELIISFSLLTPHYSLLTSHSSSLLSLGNKPLIHY